MDTNINVYYSGLLAEECKGYCPPRASAGSGAEKVMAKSENGKEEREVSFSGKIVVVAITIILMLFCRIRGR